MKNTRYVIWRKRKEEDKDKQSLLKILALQLYYFSYFWFHFAIKNHIVSWPLFLTRTKSSFCFTKRSPSIWNQRRKTCILNQNLASQLTSGCWSWCNLAQIHSFELLCNLSFHLVITWNYVLVFIEPLGTGTRSSQISSSFKRL